MAGGSSARRSSAHRRTGKLPGVGPKTASASRFTCSNAPEEALPWPSHCRRQGDCEVLPSLFQLMSRISAPSAWIRVADQTLLCVVEEPSDILSLERTHEYRGLYHVLGGALSPLDGIGRSADLDTLFSRLSQEQLGAHHRHQSQLGRGGNGSLHLEQLRSPPPKDGYGSPGSRPLPVGGDWNTAMK